MSNFNEGHRMTNEQIEHEDKRLKFWQMLFKRALRISGLDWDEVAEYARDGLAQFDEMWPAPVGPKLNDQETPEAIEKWPEPAKPNVEVSSVEVHALRQFRIVLEHRLSEIRCGETTAGKEALAYLRGKEQFAVCALSDIDRAIDIAIQNANRRAAENPSSGPSERTVALLEFRNTVRRMCEASALQIDGKTDHRRTYAQGMNEGRQSILGELDVAIAKSEAKDKQFQPGHS